MSVVGFQFLNTRVLGMSIPFHRNFEEVNLRFYVRRNTSEGWRRAVVFVKELVPRALIALTARVVYGENYIALPMKHRIKVDNDDAQMGRQVLYSWNLYGREDHLRLNVRGEAHEPVPGSEEEFITEHYWGYTRRKNRGTMEYQVMHPRWRVWTAQDAQLKCDAAELYGNQFAECLQASPDSALLADGSEVTVFKGISLPTGGDQ
jgi:hypothetical protein